MRISRDSYELSVLMRKMRFSWAKKPRERFSWELENSYENVIFLWESHEILMRIQKLMRIFVRANPNIQQISTQLLLPFSRKYDQGLQGVDTQLARCHCLDLNPASAHWARRSRKTIHEAQADVTGLTKRPEMNITTENFALTRTWTSLWPKGRQLQHSKLAAQRRTQRARARYKISWQEREKMKKIVTCDCKPRAQAIPRCCFSRARRQ